MHLKSQMNKENIASQFVFFSITHKSSLKVSFHELRTHFFFLPLLFSTVFGEEAENGPLGHALSR